MPTNGRICDAGEHLGFKQWLELKKKKPFKRTFVALNQLGGLMGPSIGDGPSLTVKTSSSAFELAGVQYCQWPLVRGSE